jgi:hypothetical protein
MHKGLRRGCIALALIVVTATCYTGPERLPSVPQGYTEFLTVSLADGVVVRLAAPSTHYETNPELYRQIGVDRLELLDETNTVGESSIKEFILELQPEGLVLEQPILLQASWSPRHDLPAERAGFFSQDAGGRWHPITTRDFSPQYGVGSALLSTLEPTAAIHLLNPPEYVEQLSPAVTGTKIEFYVKANPNIAEIYDVYCGRCESIDQVDTISGCPRDFDCSVEWTPPIARVTTTKSGIYGLIIDHQFVEQWGQGVYVAPAIDYDEWEATATKFRPALKYSDNYAGDGSGTTCRTEHRSSLEEAIYWPIAIENLFATGTVVFRESQSLNNLSFHEVSGADIASFMATHSQSKWGVHSAAATSLKSVTGGEPTVYWHIRQGDGTNAHTFITYWMFYTWDPKSPDLEAGAHPLDRESVAVELNCSNGPGTCVAEAVWYAGHLPGQTMYLLDPEDGETIAARWKGDALAVKWDKVEKEGSSRPIAYVAHGSHALYPRKGIYFVDPAGPDEEEGEVPESLLGGTEAACGDLGTRAYSLRPLNMGAIDSTSPERALLFSGTWIDVPILANERFPPFLDRFYAIARWAKDLNQKNGEPTYCPGGSCLPPAQPAGNSGPCDNAYVSEGWMTAPNGPISKDFTVSGSVSDENEIAKVTIAVDTLPGCKFSVIPAAGQRDYGFSIPVKVSSCGLTSGPHTLGLWVGDACGDAVLVDSAEFDFGETPSPCGDGTIGAGEDCEGTKLNGKTCASEGFGGGVLACGDSCQFDISGCTNPTCDGDGKVEGVEQCDGVQFAGGATCQSMGFDKGDLLCLGSCQIDTSSCYNESLTVSPALGIWTPVFTPQGNCTCSPDDEDCRTLYIGRATAVNGNKATLEFKKADGSALAAATSSPGPRS